MNEPHNAAALPTAAPASRERNDRAGARRVALLFAALLFCMAGSFARAEEPAAGAGCDIVTREIALGGGTLQYNTVGAGRQVLMLHGLFADKEQWIGMMCLLSAAGYAAVAPDLPGYGKSTGFRTQDYKLENQVELLHQFVEAIGGDVVDIAASSMGGTIAAMYTRKYPKQVRTLAFIGSPLGIIDWHDALKDAIYQGINPFIPIDVAQYDLELSLLFVTPPSIPDATKEAAVKDYVERNRHYQQVWDIVNLYDTTLDDVRMIVRAPTLILWGEEDRIFGIEGANKLRQRMHRATLVKVPAAGHLLLLESAHVAAPIYIRFLERRIY